MEITYYGRNCFRLRGREGVVLCDPCPPASGYRLPRQTADIVTLSSKHDPGYSYVEVVTGDRMLLDAPGEYEIKGVLVKGIAAPRADGTRDVIFVTELDGVRVGHLGLLQGPPPAAVLDELANVDVLLVPVGGFNALEPVVAWDLVTRIDPAVAVPMNYGTEAETLDLEPLEKLLKEAGTRPEPEARLSLTRANLPGEFALKVLTPRS